MNHGGTDGAGGDDEAAVVDRVIRRRRTTKVLAAPERRAAADARWTAAHERELAAMIETAGWAPFHRRAHAATHRGGALASPVPWRFHVLSGPALPALLGYLRGQAETRPDSKWSRAWQSKVRDMLAATGALVQVTWLPDPPADGEREAGALPEMTTNNMEHVAAAGAAVQNLLLAAEARRWLSYWSSGGILREPEVFERLGIGREEVLLGAVFLDPEPLPEARELAGGLREERGEAEGWSRRVSLG